jgi:hypothetical protein
MSGVTIDLRGAGGEATSFETLEAFREWLAAEFTQWSSLRKQVSQDSSVRTHVDQQVARVKSFLESLDSAVNGPEGQRDRAIQKLIQTVDRMVRAERSAYIPINTPKGNFVFNTAQSNSAGAASALAYLAKEPIQPSQWGPTEWKYYLQAALFDLGAVSNVEAERSALNHLRQEFRAAFEADRRERKEASGQTQAEQESKVAQAAKALSEIEKRKLLADAAFSEALNATKARCEELETTFGKQLEDLRAALSEKMRLRAPADYWSSRRFWSRLLSGLWIVTMTVGAAAFVYAYITLVKNAIDMSAAGANALLLYVLLGLTAILGLFGLRFVSKLALSSMHVSLEAGERVTMIHTYLALIEEGASGAEDDRSALLATLFRPGSSGLFEGSTKQEMPVETLIRLALRQDKGSST